MKSDFLALMLIGALVAAPAVVDAAEARAAASLFEQNCQVCHQADGVGVPGQFPRLSGRISRIAADADGRHLLSDVLLYGMSGTITVDDRRIIGVMPGFPQLSDAQIASLLNYLMALKSKIKAKPFTSADIGTARKAPAKQPSDLAKENERLRLLGVTK